MYLTVVVLQKQIFAENREDLEAEVKRWCKILERKRIRCVGGARLKEKYKWRLCYSRKVTSTPDLSAGSLTGVLRKGRRWSAKERINLFCRTTNP